MRAQVSYKSEKLPSASRALIIIIYFTLLNARKIKNMLGTGQFGIIVKKNR